MVFHLLLLLDWIGCIVPRSGLSIQCQIVADNLDCILLLPEKYREQIEGLIGNFNGDLRDDLSFRRTNQSTSIMPIANQTLTNDDLRILQACQSCKNETINLM
jgi:hypothetical protein